MHLYDVMITCYSHNHMRNTVYVRMGGGSGEGGGGVERVGGSQKRQFFFFQNHRRKHFPTLLRSLLRLGLVQKFPDLCATLSLDHPKPIFLVQSYNFKLNTSLFNQCFGIFSCFLTCVVPLSWSHSIRSCH